MRAAPCFASHRIALHRAAPRRAARSRLRSLLFFFIIFFFGKCLFFKLSRLLAPEEKRRRGGVLFFFFKATGPVCGRPALIAPCVCVRACVYVLFCSAPAWAAPAEPRGPGCPRCRPGPGSEDGQAPARRRQRGSLRALAWYSRSRGGRAGGVPRRGGARAGARGLAAGRLGTKGRRATMGSAAYGKHGRAVNETLAPVRVEGLVWGRLQTTLGYSLHFCSCMRCGTLLQN